MFFKPNAWKDPGQPTPDAPPSSISHPEPKNVDPDLLVFQGQEAKASRPSAFERLKALDLFDAAPSFNKMLAVAIAAVLAVASTRLSAQDAQGAIKAQEMAPVAMKGPVGPMPPVSPLKLDGATAQTATKREPMFTFENGFSSAAMKDHSWRTSDTVLQGLVLTSLYIDWKQTRQMEGFGWDTVRKTDANGTKHYYGEMNPLLGQKPSRATINRYFIGVAALSTYAAIKLPLGPRRAVQGGVLALEAWVTNQNRGMGLHIQF